MRVRFQVPLLTDMAVDALIANVTAENVADRLLMADAVHSADLKVCCCTLIACQSVGCVG